MPMWKGKKMASKYHTTKSGRKAKKGLYYNIMMKKNVVVNLENQDQKVHLQLKHLENQQKQLRRRNEKKRILYLGNKKNYRPTKSGAGMTKKGVAAYRRANPGSKVKNSRDW